MPAVLQMNIHQNPTSLRVCLRFPYLLGDSPRCSRIFHNRFHGAPVPVIRDSGYSDGQPACPPRVCFSTDIGASKFTLHLLSHTPGGSQGLKSILLMCVIWNKGVMRCNLAANLNADLKCNNNSDETGEQSPWQEEGEMGSAVWKRGIHRRCWRSAEWKRAPSLGWEVLAGIQNRLI